MTRQEKKKIADPKIVTDAIEVADDAGLRCMSHNHKIRVASGNKR
jgi:hypothetical protein